MLQSKKILKLIIIIFIFLLLVSLFFCKRGITILYLNKQNKGIVLEYLKDYIRTDKSNKFYADYYIKGDKDIKKVAYGRDWDEGCIYVYYSIIDTKPDKLILYEGESIKEDLARYIEENGYKEKDICKWGIICSSILIIFCTIQLTRRK